MNAGWQRRIVGRLSLIFLGVLLALLLIEAALQLGAAYVQLRGRGAPAWTTTRRRVLSLGDSNTYGLYLEPPQAYPGVFESLWNAQPGEPPLEVLNLAFPGTNSSRLLSDFPRMLRVFRPDVVTLMVGANDFWTVPEKPAVGQGAIDHFTAALWKWSRVYRLLYMLRRALYAPRLEISLEGKSGTDWGRGTARYAGEEFQLGWTAASALTPGTEPAADLQRNLEAMVAEAKAYGVEVVLLTYLSEKSFYGIADSVIRAAAQASGAPLIDLAADLRPRCPQGTCPELFPDQHPTAQGHRFAAQALKDRLQQERTR